MIFFSKREVIVNAGLALLIFGALVKILWERLAWGGEGGGTVPVLSREEEKQKKLWRSGDLWASDGLVEGDAQYQLGGWAGMVHCTV